MVDRIDKTPVLQNLTLSVTYRAVRVEYPLALHHFISLPDTQQILRKIIVSNKMHVEKTSTEAGLLVLNGEGQELISINVANKKINLDTFSIILQFFILIKIKF